MFYKKLLCLGLLTIPAIAAAEFYKAEVTRRQICVLN